MLFKEEYTQRGGSQLIELLLTFTGQTVIIINYRYTQIDVRTECAE